MKDDPTQLQAELAQLEQTITNLGKYLSGAALETILTRLLVRQAELEE